MQRSSPKTRHKNTDNLVKFLPEKLRAILMAMPALAIAWSGGLDSRFLGHAARLCGCDILLIHASGPHLLPSETTFARAAANNANYLEVAINPLALPEVKANSRCRCYFCKKNLLEIIISELEKRGEKHILCDGGNADDGKVYRPGMAAVTEAGVKSPLALAGLGKREIRSLARLTGMPFPEQKARPCLLTRFSYGMPIEMAALDAVQQAEEKIAAFFTNEPTVDFRLRITPEPLLHLNQLQPEWRKPLMEILNAQGFANAGIQEMKPLSGYFDAAYSGRTYPHIGIRD